MGSQKNSKALLVVVAALVIILMSVCITFAVFVVRTRDADPGNTDIAKEESKQREYVVTSENVDAIREELQENPTDAYYNVTMNTNWTCAADTYELKNAYIANSTLNDRTVYFDLLLPDTSEVIYSSPFIPVGQEIRGFTLEQGLPSGKHTVWVEYHLVDDDENELSTVTVTATITVK